MPKYRVLTDFVSAQGFRYGAGCIVDLPDGTEVHDNLELVADATQVHTPNEAHLITNHSVEPDSFA